MAKLTLSQIQENLSNPNLKPVFLPSENNPNYGKTIAQFRFDTYYETAINSYIDIRFEYRKNTTCNVNTKQISFVSIESK